MDRNQQINQFFEEYAARFNAGLSRTGPDASATTAVFADCFLEASPRGVVCGKNDAQFLEAIPKGYEFYRSVGITAMDIIGKQTTLLDEYHSMTRVHWSSAYTKKDGKTGIISFEVIYFLQALNGKLKVFAYITGDEQKALREHGLVA